MFAVEIEDRNGGSIQRPSEMALAPERFGWQALGGPASATLAAAGRREALAGALSWLGYRVMIRNGYATPVWWGYIEEVLLNLGEYAVGVSLEPMYNRVAVAYTYTDVDNQLQRGTTGFAENAVTAALYGRKELLHSYSDLESLADAEQLAQTLVDRLGAPVTYVRPSSGPADTAQIRCRGDYAKTAWQYAKILAGREAHESYFADQVLGVGITSTNISFTRDDKLVVPPVGMHGFKGGDKFDIAGSASNNGTRTVAAATRKEIWTYTANTIYFTLSNDMWDSAFGFDGPQDNDVLQIVGSPANSGIRAAKKVERNVEVGAGSGVYADHVEFTSNVTAEAAGTAIGVNRYGYFRTVEAQANEAAGANVTLTAWGSKIAQSFSLEFSTAPWPLHEVKLRLRKNGSPTDGVKVALHADAAGAPGAELTFGAILNGAIGADYGWESIPFSGSVSLSYGATYWLVITRTGPNDADNYYEVGVDDNEGYGRGVLRVWGAGAWQARPQAASLAFQVIGKKDVGAQIAALLTSTVGPFGSVDTFTAGVLVPMHQDGDTLVSDEVEDLATRGDSTGTRIVIDVRADGVALVRPRPSRASEIYSLRGDGSILDAYGQPLPPGVGLAGKWVRLDEPGLSDMPADSLTFFVEEAEYDAEQGRWELRPEHAPSPYDIGIQRG